MTPSGSLLIPDPAVPGNLWPVIPAQAPSRMLSLLFQLEQSQWLSSDEIQAQQTRSLGHSCVMLGLPLPSIAGVWRTPV